MNKNTDRDLGLADILKEMDLLAGAAVNVGIQDDAGTDPESGKTIAEIAYYNEYGTQDGRIPARPAHRNAFDDNRAKLDSLQVRLIKGVADGKLSADRAAKIMGETHQGFVRRSIQTLSTPANADSTIAAKGSSNPLIDTGQTLQSVRYVVEGL
jgi:hypothetical protein